MEVVRVDPIDVVASTPRGGSGSLGRDEQMILPGDIGLHFFSIRAAVCPRLAAEQPPRVRLRSKPAGVEPH